MDKPIDKVNCKACKKTHYGLWSPDDGETVACPIDGTVVLVATGQVKDAEPAPAEEKPKPKAKSKAKTKTKKGEKLETAVIAGAVEGVTVEAHVVEEVIEETKPEEAESEKEPESEEVEDDSEESEGK